MVGRACLVTMVVLLAGCASDPPPAVLEQEPQTVTITEHDEEADHVSNWVVFVGGERRFTGMMEGEREAEARGPVRSLRAELTFDDLQRHDATVCLTRDGADVPEVPCQTGGPAVALGWEPQGNETLPRGTYALRWAPVAGSDATVVVNTLRETVRLTWMDPLRP